MKEFYKLSDLEGNDFHKGNFIHAEGAILVDPKWTHKNCVEGFYLHEKPEQIWDRVSVKPCRLWLVKVKEEDYVPIENSKGVYAREAYAGRIEIIKEIPLNEKRFGRHYFATEGKHEVNEGIAYVWGSAQLKAWGSTQVKAFKQAEVEALNLSQVEAYNDVRVEANDFISVKAYDRVIVKARNHARVEAYGYTLVRAWDNSWIETHSNSHIEAHGHCHVVIHSNSRVKAYDFVNVIRYATTYYKVILYNYAIEIDRSRHGKVKVRKAKRKNR